MNNIRPLDNDILLKIEKMLDELHESYKESLCWCVYGCDSIYEKYHEDNYTFVNLMEDISSNMPNLVERVTLILYKDFKSDGCCCAYGCKIPQFYEIDDKKINCIIVLVAELNPG